MSERKKQIFLEALKKAKKESVMGKLANGDTDSMKPWSKKHAPLDEVNTQVLWRYIKAMGRDPRTISLNDRLNLARTDRFKKFARDHVKLIQQQKEEVEGVAEMDNRTPSGDRREQRSDSPEEKARRKKELQANLKKISPEMRKKLRLPDPNDPKEGVAEDKASRKTAPSWHSGSVKNPNFNDELSGRRVSPPGKRLKSGKLSADERGSQERIKALMKFKREKGGLTGPKSPLPEDRGVAEETEKKYYAIVHKTSKKVHSTYRNLDTAKHVYRQMDKDLRPHLTVMATSNPGDIKEKAVNEAGTGTLMSYIKAKGLNPLSMDGNQKNKYSQSSEFKLFKHRKMKAETSGMGERGDDWNEEKKPIKEAIDVDDFIKHLRSKGLPAKKPMSKADSDSELKARAEKLKSAEPKKPEPYKNPYPLGGRDERSGRSYSEEVEQIDELKKQPDNQDADAHITREDLRKWFSKTDPEGGWKRINSKGEAIGPCAREPGEPKPKCMSNEKRAKLTKKARAAAVAAKRKHDPVADRAGKGGKPVNVSNFGKGKLGEAATWAQQAAIAIAMKKAGKKPKNKNDMDEACWDTHKQVGMKKKGGKMVPDCVPKNEEVERIDEKNSPTNPKLWARAKSLARSKFDVYPSAYANGWASKWYKSKGGGWRATSEEVEVNEGIYGIEDSPMSATNSVKAMESRMAKEKSKSARMIKAIYKKKGLKKETIYDWEKSEKGGEKEPSAKIILKGGKTMTGKDRDTIEIDPVVRTKLNGANGTKPNL